MIVVVLFFVLKVEGFGFMWVNDNFLIVEFVEKLKDLVVIDSFVLSLVFEVKFEKLVVGEKYCLVLMGIYVFNCMVMVDVLDNNMIDFGKEIILGLFGNKKFFVYIFEGYWEDIGMVKVFFDVNFVFV